MNIATKVATPMLVLASLGLTGCMNRIRNSAPEQTVLPIVADDAMQKRDWPQSTAIYPNGGTVAGHTDFPFQPQPNQQWTLYALDDTAVFFTNLAIMPYEVFKDPILQPTTYQGNTYPPSYTAMPVLPPSQNTEPETTYPALPPVPIPVAPPIGSARATSIPSPRRQAGGMVYPSRVTTSPATRPTYNGLPITPGEQPTGSPLVTPGRGQPKAPPITLPPPTPTHPSTRPAYQSSSPQSSGYNSVRTTPAPTTPAPAISAPTFSAPTNSVPPIPAPAAPSVPQSSLHTSSPALTLTPTPTAVPPTPAAPATRPSSNNALESPSAVDLSLAPPLKNSSTDNSTSSEPLETRIVGGKLVIVPATQPATRPTTEPAVNWPPLNK